VGGGVLRGCINVNVNVLMAGFWVLAVVAFPGGRSDVAGVVFLAFS
jgi:hypothetical protein